MTDSVFLVVDSDADDLAALAGSLTSRYASEYEIRAVATASEAHATLAALSVAGVTVALLIVSRDLGDADVLLLLQRTRELFPGARRVLSVRYVDPTAFDFITAALRTGRIDYFVYKPCEPVITRLYPVVEDLLGGLRRTGQEHPFEVIQIVGEQWNPRSHRLRDLLERSTVPFGFYDSESEEGRRILAQAGVDGSHLPVLCYYYGAVLVDPTNEQVAAALGVRTTPEPGLYDVAIVGRAQLGWPPRSTPGPKVCAQSCLIPRPLVARLERVPALRTTSAFHEALAEGSLRIEHLSSYSGSVCLSSSPRQPPAYAQTGLASSRPFLTVLR